MSSPSSYTTPATAAAAAVTSTINGCNAAQQLCYCGHCNYHHQPTYYAPTPTTAALLSRYTAEINLNGQHNSLSGSDPSLASTTSSGIIPTGKETMVRLTSDILPSSLHAHHHNQVHLQYPMYAAAPLLPASYGFYPATPDFFSAPPPTLPYSDCTVSSTSSSSSPPAPNNPHSPPHFNKQSLSPTTANANATTTPLRYPAHHAAGAFYYASTTSTTALSNITTTVSTTSTSCKNKVLIVCVFACFVL